MPSLSPWVSDDALIGLFLFLGPEAVSAVSRVSQHWKSRSTDPALWALLLPGRCVSFGPDCLRMPVGAVRDGKRLAVAELGGKGITAVAFLDLCGEIVALCDEPETSSGAATVEVYDLSSRIMRRYVAAIFNPLALRVLDEESHFLLVVGSAPRPLVLIDFQAKPNDVVPAAPVIDGISWLARAGKGRVMGCQLECPCGVWLFCERSGSLEVLEHISLDLSTPTSMIPSEAVWEPEKDTTRIVIAITLPQGMDSFCQVVSWARQRDVGSGFRVASWSDMESRGLADPPASLTEPTRNANLVSSEVAPFHIGQETLEGAPDSPQSFWSDASSTSTSSGQLFERSVALAFDFVMGGTPTVKTRWISRPLEFCRGTPLRYSPPGVIFAVVSYSVCASGTNDGIAIAEINGSSGEVCRVFELPQLEFAPLICWQWVGPLLAVIEPGVHGSEDSGVMHLFSFEFSDTTDGISSFEGFRLATSTGACATALSRPSAPVVCRGLGTCHINCTGSGRLGEWASAPELQAAVAGGKPAESPLSGVWLILGTCKERQYRNHLRLAHREGHLLGGGGDMSLEGFSVLDDDGSWQLNFKQTDESGDFGCECTATVPAAVGIPRRMRGTWVDTTGRTGSFVAAREASGLRGFRGDGGLAQQWAAFGHRFAYLPEHSRVESQGDSSLAHGRRGIVLCEWPQPFVFGIRRN